MNFTMSVHRIGKIIIIRYVIVKELNSLESVSYYYKGKEQDIRKVY